MGVRIVDRVTAEGRQFQEMLRQLATLEVRIGFQHGDAAEDDGTDICDIAAWNELGTVNSPSRPFLRKSVDENEDKINKKLESIKDKLLEGASAEQALEELGLFQKDLIQKKITEGDFVPNAPSTIQKKKSSKPLIDSGRMRQSVNYVVKRKGGGND